VWSAVIVLSEWTAAMGDEAPKDADAATQPVGDEENTAATKLQAQIRGNQDRKKVAEKKEEKQKTDENNAATKMQALQRGKNDRAKVDKLKQEKKETEEQDKAATKLQASIRGKNDRKKVEEMKANKGGETDASGTNKGTTTAPKKLHDVEHVTLERVFKIFDKEGTRMISKDRFIHVLKVMGDDLKDEECEVVYKAVNTHHKDEGNKGLNYADFTIWIECTVLGMAIYDALKDQLK